MSPPAALRDTGGAVVVVGGGLAGLACALHLAPAPVVLLTAAPLGAEAASALAQGGMAAAVGADDSTDLHLADTLAAGDGLCDPEIAALVVREAPEAVAALMSRGVRFDCGPDGRPLLGLEAAHCRRRILHMGGDATGAGIVRALVAAVRAAPSITVHEGVTALRLATHDGAVAGVLARAASGPVLFPASRVVIATGGIGGLYGATTNPPGAFGQGLALAARAGAALSDMEFVQFHPTALDLPGAAPLPLISEAVRGEGATLIDETGARFIDELAPRDVVARAVARQLAAGHRVFLDARTRPGAGFAARFPGIAAICRDAGLDPARDPIPVCPAAHYHMGGIAVDAEGRASLPGLWACGEAASTGLHGANRLASNSLTEAAVFGRIVAESLGGYAAPAPCPAVPALPAMPDPATVRPLVSRALGVTRDGPALREAIARLLPMAMGDGPQADPAAVALIAAVAAHDREESRGGHYRADFPARAAVARRSRLTLPEAVARARGLTASGAGQIPRPADPSLPLRRSA
ncbi:MAG: L-aspartate oxidase [Gemmobacter sp.]